MEATLFLQLRVSLRFFPPGELTQARVEDLVARLRTREPAPYRHWFPTSARRMRSLVGTRNNGRG